MKKKKSIVSKKIRSLKIRQKRVKRLKERTTNPNIVRNTTTPLYPSTKLLLGGPRDNGYYLISNKTHRITEEEINAMKVDLVSSRGLTGGDVLKDVKIHFSINPNKVLTNKGILKRMGGGKSSHETFVLYIVPGKICVTIIPHLSMFPLTCPALFRALRLFVQKYPFLSIVSFP